MTWVPPGGDTSDGGRHDRDQEEPDGTGGPGPAPAYGAPAYGPPQSTAPYGGQPYGTPPASWPQPAPVAGQAGGRGMPWWGVVLIGLGSFGAGALVAAGLMMFIGVAVSDDDALVATGGLAGELALPEAAVGTCFTGRLGQGFDGSSVESVGGAVPCDQAHELELYGATVVALDEQASYAEYELSWFADGFCDLLFDDYVGVAYEDSQFDYMPVVPSQEAWAAGDRRVSCLLYDFEGATVQYPARDSGS